MVEVEYKVDAVQWAMDGLRLLVLAGLDIILYQHRMLTSLVRGKMQSQRSLVRFSLSEEDSPWEAVWKCTLAAKVSYLLLGGEAGGAMVPSMIIMYQCLMLDL